jgi:hypothetical protein
LHRGRNHGSSIQGRGNRDAWREEVGDLHRKKRQGSLVKEDVILIFNHEEKHIAIKIRRQRRLSIKQELSLVFSHVKPQWELKYNPKEKVILLPTQLIYDY